MGSLQVRTRHEGLDGRERMRKDSTGTWDLLAVVRDAEAEARPEEIPFDRWCTESAVRQVPGPTRAERHPRQVVSWLVVDLDGTREPRPGWEVPVRAALEGVLRSPEWIASGVEVTWRHLGVHTNAGGLHAAVELRHCWDLASLGRGGVLRARLAQLAEAVGDAWRAAGGDAVWDERCAGAMVRLPGMRLDRQGRPWRVRLAWSEGSSTTLPPAALLRARRVERERIRNAEKRVERAERRRAIRPVVPVLAFLTLFAAALGGLFVAGVRPPAQEPRGARYREVVPDDVQTPRGPVPTPEQLDELVPRLAALLGGVAEVVRERGMLYGRYRVYLETTKTGAPRKGGARLNVVLGGISKTGAVSADVMARARAALGAWVRGLDFDEGR